VFVHFYWTICITANVGGRPMSFGSRVKAARTAKKLTQQELADLVGVGKTSVSSWEKDVSVPRPKAMKKLAEALGMPTPKLQFGESGETWAHQGQGDDQPANDGGTWTVPMRGYVGAASAFTPFGDIYDEIQTTFKPEPTTEAVMLDGNSMEPAFPHGTLIFYSVMDEHVERYVGRVCIAQLADGRVLFKILNKGSRFGVFNLVSLNPDVKPIADVQVTSILPMDHAQF